MAWLYYVLLFAILLTGLALTVMTLPGLWVMLAATAIYAWLTHGAYIGWWTLLILLLLAGAAEILEFTSSGAGAKRAGGGRAGLWGAIIGGILGGIFLGVALAFIPVLNVLIGVCVGSFVGAMVGEMLAGREVGHSAWVGLGAAKGRLVGTFIKLGFGCVMLVITLGLGFPRGHKSAVTSAPAPIKTTLPATSPGK